tara:strand:- start:2501 stop:2764 length:264 start_codon:yes stop_codon:yes gene_type:complete
MHVVVLILSIAFVFIYKVLCGEKDAMKGMKYGIWFGVAVGYGTYSVMPIPYSMSLTWFLGGQLWRVQLRAFLLDQWVLSVKPTRPNQ